MVHCIKTFKKKFQVFQQRPVEVLINNRLDKNFQKIILPLTIMQLITCNIKYVILHNYITSNSVLINMLTITSSAFFIACTLNTFLSVNCTSFGNSHWYDSVFTFADVFNLFFYDIGFIINATLTALRSQRLVVLILKMNKIYITLTPCSYKIVNVTTWISIICTAFAAITINVFGYIVTIQVFFLYAPIVTLLFLLFDFNMFQIIFIINWLTRSVEIWTKEFQKCMDGVRSESKTKRMEVLLETYEDILESYKIAGDYSKETVSASVLISFSELSQSG